MLDNTDFSFSITLAVEGFSTNPLILTTFLASVALEIIVTVLEKPPVLLVSYFTLISPFSPGKIGFSGFVGTVHPQLP